MVRGKRYPAGMVLDVLEYHAEGKGPTAILDALLDDGWAELPEKRTVQNWIRHGQPGDLHVYDDATRKRAVDLYSSGRSSMQVSDEIGAAPATILSWVRAAGVPTRKYTITERHVRGKTKQRKG